MITRTAVSLDAGELYQFRGIVGRDNKWWKKPGVYKLLGVALDSIKGFEHIVFQSRAGRLFVCGLGDWAKHFFRLRPAEVLPFHPPPLIAPPDPMPRFRQLAQALADQWGEPAIVVTVPPPMIEGLPRVPYAVLVSQAIREELTQEPAPERFHPKPK